MAKTMALIVVQDVSAGLAIMLVALLMIMGWGMTYIASQIKLRRMAENFRLELRAMEERMKAALATATAAQAAPAPPMPAVQPPVKAAGSVAVPEHSQEVSPEMLLVIAAAVTAYLGKKVRIRSAQMLQTPYEIVNPWSQQGRVIVQASHNLGQRGHWE